MNFKAVGMQLSSLIGMVTILLLAPLGFSIYDDELRTTVAYGSTIVVFSILTIVIRKSCYQKDFSVSRREGLLVVSLIWLILGLGGALPYYLEGSALTYADAVFESVSGFTTTGATIMADIDNLSRATNFWRCLSHWVGGMGIVVLFVAIFPQVGVGGKQFFKNESAGPISSRVKPRIRETALSLWWIYCTLTLICIISLSLAGMDLFDAICHGFSTLGTGGFSTKGLSIGYYNSPVIEWIICIFMFIAGLNFALIYSSLWRFSIDILRNSEFQAFAVANVVVAGFIGLAIYQPDQNVFDTLRTAVFQTLAVSTSTGFMTDNFDAYPNFTKYLLFIMMFVGGCAGSTAGGLKVIRIIILWKLSIMEIARSIFPQQVSIVRYQKKALTASVIHSVTVYFVAYFFIFFVASLIVTSANYGMLESMSAVVACLSSIGPGFESFGPTQNFAHAPAYVKYVLCFCMIAGRLEIIVLFAPFTRKFWTR